MLVRVLQAPGRAGRFQSSREDHPDLRWQKRELRRGEHGPRCKGTSGLWKVASRYNIRDRLTRTKPMLDTLCAITCITLFLWHSAGWRDFRRL